MEISQEEAETYLEVFVGRTPSHVWRGYGTPINLEFGDLVVERAGWHPSGTESICINWSWRVENAHSIVAGSWSEEEVINSVPTLLARQEIKSLSLFGRLKELCIEFSNGLWLCSFSTVDGNPEWCVKLNASLYLSFKGGCFVCEGSNT